MNKSFSLGLYPVKATISAAITAALSTSLSLSVYAETEVVDSGIKASEIPAVVVSGARTEQSTLTTPASITVITRK